jgi:hypothetical protein
MAVASLSADDEEDVDAREAAPRPGETGVIKNHAEYRDRAQTVDLGSIVKLGLRRVHVRDLQFWMTNRRSVQ